MERWTGAILAGFLLIAAPAQAPAYTFADECAPKTEHAPGFTSPNVMLIVDRSGSMRISMGSLTRWETAQTVIKEVTLDLEEPGSCPTDGSPGCDPVRFGLGFFSSHGILSIEPDEGTASSIVSAMYSTYPSGQTQPHTGIDLMATSARMNDGSRPNVGVLITDGAPDYANTTKRTVRQMCTLRERANAPITSYVVGFGPGSNQSVNGFLAAAGGTGVCCEGAAYPCASAYQVDPCELSAAELNSAVRDTGVDDSTYIYRDYDCGGSLEATDGEAFKRALLDITDEVACTFRLDVPAGYPTPGASDDPDATLVEMSHVLFGDVRLPYCEEDDTNCGLPNTLTNLGIDPATAATYDDQGWYFADSSRRWVRITDGLCSEIQARSIEKIYTQVACVCTRTGESCTYTVEGFTNEQLENMRCSKGMYECVDGRDVCVAQFGPMPEICNGIDDDCDGTTDNMSTSWGKPEFQSATYTIPQSLTGIDCRQNDVCMCADGPDAVSGTDAQSFFASWSGSCMCGEGLESAADAPITDDEPMPLVDADAACSASGATGAAGAIVLFLGMLFGARRRLGN